MGVFRPGTIWDVGRKRKVIKGLWCCPNCKWYGSDPEHVTFHIIGREDADLTICPKCGFDVKEVKE